MSATSHFTHLPSEFTRLIIYKFYLRNKPNLHIISSFLFQGEQLDEDTGYPHDGRADKDSNPHEGRADKDSYLHDGRADKDSYPHDRHNQYIMSSLQLW